MAASVCGRVALSHWEDRREPWAKQDDDVRHAFELDYGRVIHSASFRSLQGKTQILSLGDSDFYRTRLTHSLEVAQVGSGILQEFQHRHAEGEIREALPTPSLMDAVCLVHDLGHPPFGHGGEVALNYCMRGAGGFEGNGQTLRILTRLEEFSKDAGANLSRRTLLGTLKYPIAYSDALERPQRECDVTSATGTVLLDRKADKPPKCYLDSEKDVVEWMLAPLRAEEASAVTDKRLRSLDCSIMNLADDISYGVHDLEDAVALGLVSLDDFMDEVKPAKWAAFLAKLAERYPEEFGENCFEAFAKRLFAAAPDRKRQFGRLIHYFLKNVEIADRGTVFADPVLRFHAVLDGDAKAMLEELKDFVFGRVILGPSVQHLEFKGQQMVIRVFEALAHDPKHFLPRDVLRKFDAANGDLRVVCDHVAAMTDQSLLRLYDRLFSPRMGSVFDRL
jgi:dGTPase